MFRWLIPLALAGCASTLTGPAEVVDGDTLMVDGRRVGLFGVDAPEAGQDCIRQGEQWSCGADAAATLRELVAGRPVVCERHVVDNDGRIIAACHVGADDLSEAMVSSGMALDFERDSAGEYADEEAEARAAGRGLWAGEFVKPWLWRRSH